MTPMTDTEHENLPEHGDMMAIFTILKPVDVEWRYDLGHSEDNHTDIGERIQEGQVWMEGLTDVLTTLDDKGQLTSELTFTGTICRYEEHLGQPDWYVIGHMELTDEGDINPDENTEGDETR